MAPKHTDITNETNKQKLQKLQKSKTLILNCTHPLMVPAVDTGLGTI